MYKSRTFRQSRPFALSLAHLDKPGSDSIFRLAALKYPKGIGCDFAGRILGKGTEVKDLQIGAEVMGMTFNPVSPAPVPRLLLEAHSFANSSAASTTAR